MQKVYLIIYLDLCSFLLQFAKYIFLTDDKYLYIRLDYPGVGPEHSYLKDIGRAEYYSVTDEEALDGQFSTLVIFNHSLV